VPDSSHSTTVLAPISISESRPNPTSATVCVQRSDRETDDAYQVPAQRGGFVQPPAAEQARASRSVPAGKVSRDPRRCAWLACVAHLLVPHHG